MRKFYLLVVALVGFATAASAQTFDVGTQNITATVGFGTYGVPVTLSYEQGVVDFGGDHKLGVGGLVGFGWSTVFVAGECNYHFVGVEKLDLYGGVRLGVHAADSTGLFTSFDIGCNYYFNPAWAINAELGSGLGAIGLGITHKF